WLLGQCPRGVNATNINGRTPLHIAAQKNNVEMCEVLIDYGAHINPLMVNAKVSMQRCLAFGIANTWKQAVMAALPYGTPLIKNRLESGQSNVLTQTARTLSASGIFLDSSLS
ncbi:hypothetical protein AVEN_210576-1, partial [Araneus ventricosus]